MRWEEHRADGMRTDTLGPKFALRLSHLREWHRLEARCFSDACGHTALLDTKRLIRRCGIQMDLRRIEDKLMQPLRARALQSPAGAAVAAELRRSRR
jgi:hypothetical protein